MMAARKVNSGLTFKATMVQVSVPASSANIGPGFDSFGLALEIRDRYAAQVLDEPNFDVDVSGEGASEIKIKLLRNLKQLQPQLELVTQHLGSKQ